MGIRTEGRMTTNIERTFRRTPEGYFREVFLHFIHFIDQNGKITSSKLDKMIPGKLYVIGRPGQRSSYGEVEYTFPTGEMVKLLCLGDNL